MIIAREKKKKNIIEYILYMFQIENSLRALQLDTDQVEKQLIAKYDQPDEVKKEIREWYRGLITMMKEEKIETKGHLQFLRNTINDLYGIHIMILKSGEDKKYEEVFNDARNDLALLQKKTGHDSAHEVETGLEGIYGYLLLQIRNREITAETREAIRKITEWLYLLATRYRQFESGEKEL